jgi:phosphatidylserine/phosphatidylglycerophosphate/cardiolipin synthase-like enzyme
VRPVDLANKIHCHKLAKSGGEIYRYTEKYMHAKVVWNDNGKVLFGSANMDAQAMRDNFECSVVLESPKLAEALRWSFVSDQRDCVRQTPSFFRRSSLPLKTLSYACNLASGWL